MNECVSCGGRDTSDGECCRDCTWPFALDGWEKTTRRIRNVTIDTCCINAKHAHDDLNTLERWAEEDRLDIRRSEAMLEELGGAARIAKAHTLEELPQPFTIGVSTIGGLAVIAGPDISGELPAILFPTSNPLTPNQRFDVMHLALHIQRGGHIFVTLDESGFIKNGRQERLREQGIWVFTPAETVGLLKDLYGWS